VRITYDSAKRDKTLAERGLDFADATKVFAGATLTLLDDRQDYGETRFQTYGLLDRQLKRFPSDLNRGDSQRLIDERIFVH
jgi:uncharacterized protein